MTSTALRQPYRRINYQDNDIPPEEVVAASITRISTDNQLGSSLDDQERRIERAVQRGEIKSLNFPSSSICLKYRFRDEAISGFGMVGRDGL
jgi:hypothetical protein